MPNTKDIKREELIAKLEVGAVIHINTDDNKLKYRTSFLGCDQGTLLTSLPTPKQLSLDESAYADFLSEQQVLIIRLIASGVIYAFKSNVLTTHTSHCRLLLSTFPDIIQARPLRQSIRYPCALQAGYIIGETKYRGAVVNVSQSGCLFRMKVITNKAQLESIKSNGHMSTLEIHFPMSQGVKPLEVTLKSIQEDNDGYLLLGMLLKDESGVVKNYIESMQLEELTEFLSLAD